MLEMKCVVLEPVWMEAFVHPEALVFDPMQRQEHMKIFFEMTFLIKNLKSHEMFMQAYRSYSVSQF